MKFLRPVCPQCGSKIRGTVDTITGIALMREVEGHPGEYDYEGETKVDWDSQQTQDSESGLLVQGECHHTWFSLVEGQIAALGGHGFLVPNTPPHSKADASLGLLEACKALLRLHYDEGKPSAEGLEAVHKAEAAIAAAELAKPSQPQDPPISGASQCVPT